MAGSCEDSKETSESIKGVANDNIGVILASQGLWSMQLLYKSVKKTCVFKIRTDVSRRNDGNRRQFYSRSQL
jgi:hypothetical protein